MLAGLALVCTHALAASVAVRHSALAAPACVRAPSSSRAAVSLKLSKRMALAEKSVDAEKLYVPEEAVGLMKKLASAKFIETAEAHIRLNIDPKYNDQQIRTTVALPKGTGKEVRIAVLAEGQQAEAAKTAGADLVGWEDLVESISKGTLDFDVLIASPPAMPKIAKLGRVLGPKGLMPSPKVSAEAGRLPRRRVYGVARAVWVARAHAWRCARVAWRGVASARARPSLGVALVTAHSHAFAAAPQRLAVAARRARASESRRRARQLGGGSLGACPPVLPLHALGRLAPALPSFRRTRTRPRKRTAKRARMRPAQSLSLIHI